MIICIAAHAVPEHPIGVVTIADYTRSGDVVGEAVMSASKRVAIYACFDHTGNAAPSTKQAKAKLNSLGWGGIEVQNTFRISQGMETCDQERCWMYTETKEIGPSVVSSPGSDVEAYEIARVKNILNSHMPNGTKADAAIRYLRANDVSMLFDETKQTLEMNYPFAEQKDVLFFAVHVSCPITNHSISGCAVESRAVPYIW